MSITQAGDTTVISYVSVPNDAGPAMRAESVQGGFVALPTGSGPPDTTRLPLVMRRVGQVVYTPTDNKFWQLIGGTADVNWVEKKNGSGGLITVVDNNERDVIPAIVRTEGMIVYSKKTKVYYSLCPDLTSWRIVGAHPILATQAAWYVSQSTGNNNNAGTVLDPIASVDELRDRLNANGKYRPEQSTSIYVLDGHFATFELDYAPSIDLPFDLQVFCSVSSGTSITLSTVANTRLSGTTSRGRIQTGSGTFSNKARVRSTSGAQVGAITYVNQITSSTDAWVKSWWRDTGGGGGLTVDIASGTTCVVETPLVTFDRLQIKLPGHRLGGTISIYNAKLPYGAEFVNTVGGSSAISLQQCVIGNSDATPAVARVSGNCQIRNCYITGTSNVVLFNIGVPVLRGCYIDTQLFVSTACQLFDGNCFTDGGYLSVGTISGQTTLPGNVSLNDTEWTNGSGITAITIDNGGRVRVAGSQFGFGSSYAIGFNLLLGGNVAADSAAYLGINATQQVRMAGQNHTYADMPKAYDLANCSFGITGISGAPTSAVNRFGATFYVNPTYTGYSDGTQSNPYTSVTNAISAAPSTGALIILAPYSTSAENVTFPTAGNWEVRCESEVSSIISGNITVSGGSGTVTLTNITVTGTVSGSSTVANRYFIINNTNITGATSLTASGGNSWVCIANGLGASYASYNGTFGSSVSVAGSIQANDYYISGSLSINGASQIIGCRLNNSGISAVGTLLIEHTSFSAAPTFTGACAITVDGYSHASAKAAGGITLAGGATLVILNSVGLSGIQQDGASVNQVPTWNGSSWVASTPPSAPVSSVFGRTGSVVATLNDYTSSLVQNLSTVTSGGSTVTTALNSLQSQISSSVSGVSSVFGRSGVVTATAGDYNSSLVTNSSSNVSGPHVSAALDILFDRDFLGFKGVISATASRTLQLSDEGRLIVFNPSSPGTSITVTVPLNSSAALPIGYRTSVMIFTSNVSAFSIVGSSGVDLRLGNSYNLTRYRIYNLDKIDTDTWILTANTNFTGDIVNGSSVPGTYLNDAIQSLLMSFPNGAVDFNTPGSITLSLSNIGKVHRLNAVGTFTFNIQNTATSGIQVGSSYRIIQYAPGSKLDISTGSGVSLLGNVTLSPQSYTQYELVHVATDIWRVNTIKETVSRRYISLLSAYPSDLYNTSTGISGSTYWQWSDSDGYLFSNGSPGSRGRLRFPAPSIPDQYITGIGMTLSGPGGFLPSPMPTLSLYGSTYTPSAPATLIATATDTSSTIAAYTAVHSLSASFSPQSSRSMWLDFQGEGYGGTQIYDIWVETI